MARSPVYECCDLDFLCAQHRVVGKQWLAAPTSWPGFNPSSPNVAMVQLVGTPVPSTDQNKILDPHAVGAHWPAGSPYGNDPLGVFMALTDSEQAELPRAARQINATIGAGQTSFQGTVEAILSTVQALVNEGRSQSGAIVNSVGAARDAVFGYLAAHPTTVDLSDAEKQAIVDGVVTAFEGHAVDVNPGPILDALNARLASKEISCSRRLSCR